MLELAEEYGGDLLDFMKKYRKLPKKVYFSTDNLRKGHGVYIGHPVHRDQIFSLKIKGLWHRRLPMGKVLVVFILDKCLSALLRLESKLIVAAFRDASVIRGIFRVRTLRTLRTRKIPLITLASQHLKVQNFT
jgi:hypothetical protein